MVMEPELEIALSVVAGTVDKASSNRVEADSLSAVSTGAAIVVVVVVATAIVTIGNGGSSTAFALGILVRMCAFMPSFNTGTEDSRTIPPGFTARSGLESSGC